MSDRVRENLERSLNVCIQDISQTAISILTYKSEEEKKFAGSIRNESKLIEQLTDPDLVVHDYIKASESIIKSESELSDPLEPQNISSLLSKMPDAKADRVRHFLEVVRKQINPQIASIFLYSKGGSLERVGILGRDKNGDDVQLSWPKLESYKMGHSMIGRAACPMKGSYGELQIYDSSDESTDSHDLPEYYSQLLGDIVCAISIPLNGRNKTYGVLQIVNKIDEPHSLFPSRDVFGKGDLLGLLFLGASISNSLSTFRHGVQSLISDYLGRLLIYPWHQNNVYQEIIELLVNNPETSFKAGVIRIINGEDVLEVKATAETRDITGVRDDRTLQLGEGLAGLVAKNRTRLTLHKLGTDKEIRKFKNQDWIRENNFESFGCFPITIKDEVFGTLSLYTGYNYEFYPDSINFIQRIVDLLAAYLYGLKISKIHSEVEHVCSQGASDLENVNYNQDSFEEIASDNAVSLESQGIITPYQVHSSSIEAPVFKKKNLDRDIEMKVLSLLDSEAMSLHDIIKRANYGESRVRRIVSALMRNGYIDFEKAGFLRKIFPHFVTSVRRSNEFVARGNQEYLDLTRRGYFMLHPIWISDKSY